ncbi:MAG TPA: ethanolamine ammonia-lyase subunit EutC [Stellaceae bacterium]|nr:ethanolamine ammonia-lyase subunit EutC [Stellaceae bacterium]
MSEEPDRLTVPASPADAQAADARAADAWVELRRFTPARIALGAAGISLPTPAHLDFQEAHAAARDAVHEPLDVPRLAADLAPLGQGAVLLARSRAPDRATYLKRPDLGRRLDLASAPSLRAAAGDFDLAFVIADGLSSRAVQRNALPLLAAVLPILAAAGWRVAPLTIAAQGRVAIGDDCAMLLGARMVAVLIGERPGLSAADSLGVYLTWQPSATTRDSERNCLSNIRAEGLPPDQAAAKLIGLAMAARRLGLTGIGLKETAALPEA